jgi:hypothetical protein
VSGRILTERKFPREKQGEEDRKHRETHEPEEPERRGGVPAPGSVEIRRHVRHL